MSHDRHPQALRRHMRPAWPALCALPALLTARTAAAAHIACPPAEPSDRARLLVSPAAPRAGQPVRLVLAVEGAGAPPPLQILPDRAGAARPRLSVRASPQPGPPGYAVATSEPLARGSYRAVAGDPDAPSACMRFEVVATPPAPGPVTQYWPVRAEWDRGHENLYSAFVAHLFDAPPDDPLDFRPLAPALRDRARNFLWNHLGLGEDDLRRREAPRASPDCADLPYFLRAYFAWKLGLPMALRSCDRGASDRPPRCGEPVDNSASIPPSAPLPAFRRFERLLTNTVHSGAARTALDDEATDLYPVALDRDSLRPGTVFADPYGHVLVLTRWVPPRAGKPGLLLAVDGQPDASITRKRFWEGTFLYANDVPSAGAGWKRFRPPGATNAELARATGHARFSLAQRELDGPAFHARMAALINPDGIDPVTAFEATLDALVEQLEARVRSVDNGEAYLRGNPGAVIDMPEGARIFETVGPWEDYATPSRDLRLLIALRVLRELPARIERHPELYRLGERTPARARAEIEALSARRTRERAFTYTRSDGSPQALTVADVLARAVALEIAYNPNDCVEHRWGAPEGSPERASCERRAPGEQRARMESYRTWFAQARRPPR